jgi:hypothetical protein
MNNSITKYADKQATTGNGIHSLHNVIHAVKDANATLALNQWLDFLCFTFERPSSTV